MKKAEIHGMSQRGGSVTSDVRFGDEVLSPMVPAGEADFLVVLEARPGRSRTATSCARAACCSPPDAIDLDGPAHQQGA